MGEIARKLDGFVAFISSVFPEFSGTLRGHVRSINEPVNILTIRCTDCGGSIVPEAVVAAERLVTGGSREYLLCAPARCAHRLPVAVAAAGAQAAQMLQLPPIGRPNPLSSPKSNQSIV